MKKGEGNPDNTMVEKGLIVILCILGLAATFYGLIKENNGVFLSGIIFVIAGYLMIRKRLKESIEKKE